jgi:Fe-S-cluster-containing hydrogenase component 2
MTACPVNAISIEPDSQAKVVTDSMCIGCHLCTIACPFGTVYTLPKTAKASKCNLCGGNPACVTSCPTDAIEFLEADQVTDWFEGWAKTVDSSYESARV